MNTTWNTVWMTVTGLAAACFLAPYVWRLMKAIGRWLVRHWEIPVGLSFVLIAFVCVQFTATGTTAIRENKDLRDVIKLLREDLAHEQSVIFEMKAPVFREVTNHTEFVTNTFVGDVSSLEFVDTGCTISDWESGGECTQLFGALELNTPAHFITFGDDVIIIDSDTGKVTLADDLSMDDASKEFWSGLSQAFPSMFERKEVSE